METQPSTLRSYENNGLSFFEAIKHANPRSPFRVQMRNRCFGSSGPHIVNASHGSSKHSERDLTLQSLLVTSTETSGRIYCGTMNTKSSG